jgi:CDP-diacylglycerol--glycerol-3-phosphate 3-phosphatidyltransferase
MAVMLIPVLANLSPIADTVLTLVGAFLFIAASVTDMLDGKIARKHNLITDFGKFLDPLADKFMVIGALVCIFLGSAFSGNKVMTTVYFFALVIIIFRELAITSLRLVLVNASGTVVAANMLGKIKTVSQIACICLLFIEPLADALILHLAPDYELAGVYPLSWLLVGVMSVFTLWSGINYIKGGWKFIATDW